MKFLDFLRSRNLHYSVYSRRETGKRGVLQNPNLGHKKNMSKITVIYDVFDPASLADTGPVMHYFAYVDINHEATCIENNFQYEGP